MEIHSTRPNEKKKPDAMKKDKSLHDRDELTPDADAKLPNGLHIKHGNGIVVDNKQTSPLVARVYSRKRARDAIAETGSKRSRQRVDERVNHILGKTADLVLVLAGLSQMRGGRPPTEMEIQLADDAENSLAALVSRISPSSFVTKQSLDGMIASMGFRKTNEGSVEPVPRPQEDAKPKSESDSDDESSEDDANQLQSAWDPFPAALLTSPNALSLDDDADGDLKQADDFEEIQDEQAQGIRHKQLITLVQQLKSESYVPQQMCDVSNAYMITPVTCDVCQCVSRDTAGVVVCDGCEKAFHLKCLPFWDCAKGDWSCPKCNGVKPRYGPVKKGSGTPNKMPIRKPDGKQPPSTPPPQQPVSGFAANGPGEATKTEPKPQLAPSQEVIDAMEKLKAQAAAQAAQAQAQAAAAAAATVAAAPAETPNESSGQVCLHVDWVGSPARVVDKRVYYSSCIVGGWTYKLQDCALFRPELANTPPYIARLQTLWEDLDTGSKWVRVNWCYYPNDMPDIPGRPADTETDEVFESNHCDNNLVGSIQGPCQVLVPHKYWEERARRQKVFAPGVSDELPPIFLCRFTYNAQRGLFQKVKDGS